jgi:hypothetical protein
LGEFDSEAMEKKPEGTEENKGKKIKNFGSSLKNSDTHIHVQRPPTATCMAGTKIEVNQGMELK